MLRSLVLALAVAALLPACAKRTTPYPFRARLASAVRAPRLHRRDFPKPPRQHQPRRSPPVSRPPAVAVDELPAPHRDQPGSVYSQKTQPAAQSTEAMAAHQASAGVAESLRALVGKRDRTHSSLEFALLVLDSLGVHLPETRRRHLATGAELLAWAERRDALTRRAPLAGDLVVFDRGSEPAALVGVVVGPVQLERHQTVEFVYLDREVVRRGYVTPGAPARKRDDHGRALNTFIRRQRGAAPDRGEFLAGELFRAFIRIDRLAR